MHSAVLVRVCFAEKHVKDVWMWSVVCCCVHSYVDSSNTVLAACNEPNIVICRYGWVLFDLCPKVCIHLSICRSQQASPCLSPLLCHCPKWPSGSVSSCAPLPQLNAAGRHQRCCCSPHTTCIQGGKEGRGRGKGGEREWRGGKGMGRGLYKLEGLRCLYRPLWQGRLCIIVEAITVYSVN